MGCFLISQSLSGFPIETDILKLLPETRTDPLTERAYRQFETASGRKVVFLIASESAEEAAVSSESFYQSMLDSGLFEKISYKVDPERAKKTYEVYFPHRQALLSDEQRRALLEEQSERITSQATKSLLSPISTGSANLVNDPLFTFTEFLRELQSQGAAFTIDGELLRAEKDGVNSVVLVGVLKENAFSMTAQARFKDFYQTAKRIAESQGSDVQVLSAGVIHHAIAGTDSARHDISTIGVGSLVGVVVLVLVAFRSVGPLLVSAIPIVVGCVCALAVCVLIFDKVHLFTLVFGSSLIGVSIDYSFHYFSERLGAGASWDPRQGLKNIFPGVTLGLVTSLAAYLAMAIAPFSGLQQIALFSTVGLTAAYLTVILWYPGLLPHAARSTRPLTLEVAQQYISCWPEGKLLKQKAVFALACCAMTAFLASHLQVDDNVRALQDSPPGVLAEEELVKEIVGTSSGSQFFVVRGSSADSVLVDEETLTILLDEQVQKGALKRYRAISKVLPSAARQMENYSLLRDQVLSLIHI